MRFYYECWSERKENKSQKNPISSHQIHMKSRNFSSAFSICCVYHYRHRCCVAIVVYFFFEFFFFPFPDRKDADNDCNNNARMKVIVFLYIEFRYSCCVRRKTLRVREIDQKGSRTICVAKTNVTIQNFYFCYHFFYVSFFSSRKKIQAISFNYLPHIRFKKFLLQRKRINSSFKI